METISFLFFLKPHGRMKNLHSMGTHADIWEAARKEKGGRRYIGEGRKWVNVINTVVHIYTLWGIRRAPILKKEETLLPHDVKQLPRLFRRAIACWKLRAGQA